MNRFTERRRLLASALATCGLAIAGHRPTIAAPAIAAAGRMCYGYAAGSPLVAGMPALLKAMQGLYSPDLGQALVVFPGNAGARALEEVNASPADGASVLLSPDGPMTLLPHLRHLPKVDPVADFMPVASICEFMSSFVVGPAVPPEVTTMHAYLDWVRHQPTQGSYGVAALGIPPHAVGTVMARRVGVELKAVSYQGANPMLKDVAAGSLPAALTSALPTDNGGYGNRIRILAVTSDVRWGGLPDVPTLGELGLCDIPAIESLGLFVRTGTPAAKVQELNEAVQQAQRSEAVVSAMQACRLRMLPLAADAYAADLAEKRERWRVLGKRERLSLQG